MKNQWYLQKNVFFSGLIIQITSYKIFFSSNFQSRQLSFQLEKQVKKLQQMFFLNSQMQTVNTSNASLCLCCIFLPFLFSTVKKILASASYKKKVDGILIYVIFYILFLSKRFFECFFFFHHLQFFSFNIKQLSL